MSVLSNLFAYAIQNIVFEPLSLPGYAIFLLEIITDSKKSFPSH